MQLPTHWQMLFVMEMSAFAERLQREIDARGTDRKAVSRATGIPYHRLDPWFRRIKAKPRSDDLLVIARFLDVDPDYLLKGGERRPFDPGSEVMGIHAQLESRGRQELEEFARFLLQRQQQLRAIEQEQPPSQQERLDPGDE